MANALVALDEENDEGIRQLLYLGWNRLGDVLLEVVVLQHLVQRHPNVRQRGVGVEGGQLFHGQWACGAEERGFKQLGERCHGR